jgi:hypothetical protein
MSFLNSHEVYAWNKETKICVVENSVFADFRVWGAITTKDNSVFITLEKNELKK